MNGMKQRVITGIVAAALFLPLAYLGGVYFELLVFLMATIGLSELLRMRKISWFSFQGILSFVLLWIILLPENTVKEVTKLEGLLTIIFIILTVTVLTKNRFTFDDAAFIILSGLYVGAGFFYVSETRAEGLAYLFFVLFSIWAADSGAYFIGRKFGKRKLWPEISPKKTVEGAIGGIISALALAFVFYMILPFEENLLFMLLIAFAASIFGQIGDLVESAFKRHYGVKDSGTILPGHGGILDRVDSWLFVMPVLHFLHLL